MVGTQFPIGSNVVYQPPSGSARHPRFIGKRGIITRRSEGDGQKQEVFILVDSRIILLVAEAHLKPTPRRTAEPPGGSHQSASI